MPTSFLVLTKKVSPTVEDRSHADDQSVLPTPQEPLEIDDASAAHISPGNDNQEKEEQQVSSEAQDDQGDGPEPDDVTVQPEEDDSFGDDFDDFEEGEEIAAHDDDDFGDFDDGFQEAEVVSAAPPSIAQPEVVQDPLAHLVSSPTAYTTVPSCVLTILFA